MEGHCHAPMMCALGIDKQTMACLTLFPSGAPSWFFCPPSLSCFGINTAAFISSGMSIGNQGAGENVGILELVTSETSRRLYTRTKVPEGDHISPFVTCHPRRCKYCHPVSLEPRLQCLETDSAVTCCRCLINWKIFSVVSLWGGIYMGELHLICHFASGVYGSLIIDSCWTLTDLCTHLSQNCDALFQCSLSQTTM